MSASSGQVRILTSDDLPLVERLLRTSEYTYQHFTQEELPALLKTSDTAGSYLAVGIFHGGGREQALRRGEREQAQSLLGFLLAQTVNASSAWISGFGVSWTESHAYGTWFRRLFEYLAPLLVARGVRYLHYSGSDVEQDWLRDDLLSLGFTPHRLLHAYDKFNYYVPTQGNQQVTIRQFEARDIPALLSIEKECFEELWRYDAVSLIDIASTHPYFVVAEGVMNHARTKDARTVVGYQFNALDGDFGCLVRIAVHPAFASQGIGARLLAEAIRFFEEARVLRIMLNTQDDNTYARRLYEWFGFMDTQQTGFVLRKEL